MIPLFTLVLVLIGASELRNIRQTNGQRDVRLISAETTSKNFESVRLNNTSELGPTINLIQSGPKGLAKDDPSPSKFDMNHKRVPRGASDGRAKKGDQQFPFSHRYPTLHDSSDYFTTPHSQRSYPTLSLDRGSSTTMGLHVEGGERNNDSAEKGTTGIHNPLYPVTDSSYSAYAVMLLSLVVFAVGITGNLAVMCIVWHNYYMKSAWNSILASLAFWDFLVLFFCLPVVVFNELTKKRLLGDVSCRIVPYLEVTSLGVTTFSLCALGIDRFHAATSLQPKTRQVEQCQSILAKLAVVWIGSMILAVPELLLWQLSQDASGPTGVVVESCTMRPSPSLPESIFSLVHTYHDARMWWYFGCYFCLPLLFTLSCQLVTRRIGGGATPGLESRPLPSSSSSSSTSSSSPKKLQQEKLEQKRDQQLNCTVVALTTVYAVCGLPENVCNIALAYTSTQVAAPTLALLALINQFFLFFKSSLTPVLLLCLCKSLGQSFMDCCCCCCEECLSDGVSSSASTSSSSPSSACRSAGGKPKSCSSEISPSIFFDKAKDNSSILAIGTPC